MSDDVRCCEMVSLIFPFLVSTYTRKEENWCFCLWLMVAMCTRTACQWGTDVIIWKTSKDPSPTVIFNPLIADQASCEQTMESHRKSEHLRWKQEKRIGSHAGADASQRPFQCFSSECYLCSRWRRHGPGRWGAAAMTIWTPSAPSCCRALRASFTCKVNKSCMFWRHPSLPSDSLKTKETAIVGKCLS